MSLVQRPTRKKSSAASLALPEMPASRGGSSPSSAAPLGQTRIDWTMDPLRSFNFFRLKRGEWFTTITDDPETYTSPVLKARGEELGARIAALKRTLSQPPREWTGDEWQAAAERLARLEGQQAAIADVLEARAALQRSEAPPWRTRLLFQARRGAASEEASPSTVTPDPFDIFAAE